MPIPRLAERALNRALLARQGLLDPLDLPLAQTVESVGALQAQHWPSIPVALWSRTRELRLDAVLRAFQDHELLLGTLLRGTLHVVSAREYPAYAVVADESGLDGWGRAADGAPVDVGPLAAALVAHAERGPLSVDESAAFLEDWIGRHAPGLEGDWLARMRQYRWRPFRTASAFVRVPGDGRWRSRAPEAVLAARRVPGMGGRPSPGEALAAVVRRHLRAFGPAAAEDVASWTGRKTPLVRAALEGLGGELARFQDEAGRTLYDLPDAPRPDPGEAAVPRFLAGFDSVLLAYASRRRARIVPEGHRDRVYLRANLQVLPTFLVDGFVAGTWSVDARRSEATLTLRPFGRLARATRTALVSEGERLVRFSQPTASAHRVQVDGQP